MPSAIQRKEGTAFVAEFIDESLYEVNMDSRKLIPYSVLFIVALTTAFRFIDSRNESAFKVCFNEACVSVETPEGDDEMSLGLMFRKKLVEDKGMLFIFQTEDLWSFWMKNMSFPIDIIWMDSNRNVVHIEKNIPPCEKYPCKTYKPKAKAKFVLEVVAGFADRHNITLDSNASFQ